MAQDRPLTVGILLYQDVTTLDFVGPATYFEFLGVVSDHKVNIFTIADKAGGPVQPVNLIPLEASLSIDEAPFKWDVLLVPGGLGAASVVNNKKMLEYVRQAASQSTDVLMVCTGSRIMSATGLLDGKNATTNKSQFDEISELYPHVNWIHQARWVVDGKWWTSSGVSAGIDMGYAYFCAKFGTDVATKVVRTMEYVPNTDSSNDPFAQNPTASTPESAKVGTQNILVPILRVGILLYENATPLDFMGPGTYLEKIQLILGQKTEFYTVAQKAGPVQPLNMIPLHATFAVDEAPVDWDILVIPGGVGTEAAIENEKFMAYVKAAAENSKQVLSVCTGGRMLGATGLLDGKKATTNKIEYNEISAAYPNVSWIEQARWVVDGKWWTASGVTAGLDMAHAFISVNYGEAYADKIATVLEYVPNKDPSNDPFVQPKSQCNANLPIFFFHGATGSATNGIAFDRFATKQRPVIHLNFAEKRSFASATSSSSPARDRTDSQLYSQR
ncbi:hypothetical protein Poli38472_008581 [Pythium oligandrum]|uniref:DJ-1/PfpI domain-containing protein n=1 Tax=Pythium oligandrum TaxID=41045 RepID=A0A8K1FEJ8_PYTOL|nr:hypothetical protein Poli38472_008581 [Pythium oligandrum]|eukprot:TMW55933.1 hypothetical protein Poli38472_008581 [Pythium oligandrum]